MTHHIGVTALACFLAASCADETPSAKTEMDVVRTLDPPSDPCDVRHHAGRMKLHVNIASDGKVILAEALETTFSQSRVVFTLHAPDVDAGPEGWRRTQAE